MDMDCQIRRISDVLHSRPLNLLFVLLLCRFFCCISVDTESLQGKLIFGYQGWFQTNQSPQGWRHWSQGQPTQDSVTFDLWPAVDEFPEESLSDDTDLHDKATGEKMKLYDALQVTDVHFQWMQRYEIHGVALQRFLGEVSTDQDLKRRIDDVMLSVKSSAEKYDRAFFVEYDISGANPDTWVDDLLSDWDHIQDLGVTSSPAYQKNENKIVIKVYGMGFTSFEGTPDQCLRVINTLKEKSYYFVGAVPTHWRTGDGDSQSGYDDVYAAMDVISPWLVGRYGNQEEFENYFNGVAMPDIQLTSARSQGFVPTVFPGFSWTNLQRNYGSEADLNAIPRNGGQFWEMQINRFFNDLVDPDTGTHAFYVMGAMFDEFDEGTAMAKAASTVDDIPAEGTFLYLSIDGEEIPSDFYLLLAQKYSYDFINSPSHTKYSSVIHNNRTIHRDVVEVLKKKAYQVEVARSRRYSKENSTAHYPSTVTK